ncbi:hypothetical protein N665_0587s0013 [Sinapis alba]|nr:hypothetical protein N665_0587s0013 [Sinapis alba]
MSQRFTAEDKGKKICTEPVKGPSIARIKVQESDNSELLQRHALTLIGRVTNRSVQKVWSLIPFFSEHWKTERRPVGADLRNGLFQFQFALESDMLQPTISKSFPALIPFWIKVQGIPVHLWTENTIRSIGEEIGVFEEAEITPLAVRIRVQVNGLLPLITSTIIEYPNGDEVTASLVYERLEKHCSKCFRLDHELKECLEAKHQNKALKSTQERSGGSQYTSASQWDDGPQEPRTKTYQFSASIQNEDAEKRAPKRHHNRDEHRPYKEKPKAWQNKSMQSQSYNRREEPNYGYERAYRPHREHRAYRTSTTSQVKSYYREVQRNVPRERDHDSAVSCTHIETSVRGDPLWNCPVSVPKEAVERVRQAEEQGQVEESAFQMVCANLSTPTGRVAVEQSNPTPERIPVAQRLGPALSPTCISPATDVQELSSQRQNRLPAAMRLGPSSSLAEHDLEIVGSAQESPPPERIPVVLRLGPSGQKSVVQETLAIPKEAKRKPGRPPGKKKAQETALPLGGEISKKRKVNQSKPSPIRRKGSLMGRKATTNKSTAGTSRVPGEPAEETSSDNRPICNMIPASTRKRMDFRIQSTFGP